MMDARDRALRYLNARTCTCHQMKEYLRRKGYEDEEIDPVIEELREYHYLDDLKYASAFIEAGYEKGRGIGRMRRELREKGVDAGTIAFAEENLEDRPDEYEMAMDLAKNMIAGTDTEDMDWTEREKLKAKVARRLAGRGFSGEIIYRIIGRLL